MPESEKAAGEVMALPVYPEMTEEERNGAGRLPMQVNMANGQFPRGFPRTVLQLSDKGAGLDIHIGHPADP